MALSGRIVNYEKGYALTLPDGWIRADENGEFVAAMRETAKSDPASVGICGQRIDSAFKACRDAQIVQFERGVRALLEGAPIAAFDLSRFGTKFPRIAIAYSEFFVDASAVYLQGYLTDALRARGVTGDIQTEIVQLPAGEAIKLSYQQPLGEGLQGPVFQFGIPTDFDVHWILVEGANGDEDLGTIAGVIAESVEILTTD